MGMQKNKKVSKASAAVKPEAKKTASKNAQAKPAAKKVASAKPKAKGKGKSKGPKIESRPSATHENPATNTPLTKEEFKNMSTDDQDHYKKWLKLHKQLSVEKPLDYKMSEDFELKAPISHKVHGWGVVMQKRDNYIDVLFEVGLKTLIVNYKS